MEFLFLRALPYRRRTNKHSTLSSRGQRNEEPLFAVESIGKKFKSAAPFEDVILSRNAQIPKIYTCLMHLDSRKKGIAQEI